MRPARVLLAIGALAVAGCDGKPAAVESSASGQEQASPPPAATPPPALAMPQGRFEAITNTAMGVTGDLDASGREFRFAQGQAYRLAAVGRLKASAAYASTKASFASLINVPDTADLAVLKVESEDKGKARNGGFCGADRTTFLVAHRGVDGGGSPAFFLMAFKGVAAPSESSPESDLCGTFMYAPKGG